MLLNKNIRHRMKLLRSGEHAEFGTSIVDHIKAIIITIVQLLVFWNKYEALVEHENLIFQKSTESIESHGIAISDKERDRIFNEFKHRLRYSAKDSNPAIRHAAEEIIFVLKPYAQASKKNLFEETKYIQNFLVAINSPAHAAALGLLPNAAYLLPELSTRNTELYELYTQRLMAREALDKLGRSADIRLDVDAALVDLIDHINIVHEYNEITVKDADLKAKLENAADHVKALCTQTERILSHRRHHKTKEKDAGKTPATPPAAPPQAPAGSPQQAST
jgi:hypothetical protein